ncbi:MAG: GNAT family N-acetyltransferase [Myxococcota bacterium]
MEIRPCADVAELRRAMVVWHYFGGEPSLEDMERFASFHPPDRMFGAWEGATCVGGAGGFPFRCSLPHGRDVASSGVTAVGVAPTHRRQGVLTALMRAQLDDLHARGEPVAWLWASESTIYGRFGYGLASLAAEIAVPRERTRFALDLPSPFRARLVSHEEALAAFPVVYDAVYRQRPGMTSRSTAWWANRRLHDNPARRGGAGVLNRALFEDHDGRPVGYALYRVRQQLERHVSVGAAVVVEVMGVSPEATRAAWRFALDLDWVARIEASLLPVDHPLTLLVAEPRRLAMSLADGVWVRLVDVGAALSARGYAPHDPVVFEVDDPFCRWNTGRWRLADGVAARTDASPDLRLGVDALGSVYLGGFSLRRLAEAGRVEEVRPGAIALADRAFAADAQPWCPEVF